MQLGFHGFPRFSCLPQSMSDYLRLPWFCQEAGGWLTWRKDLLYSAIQPMRAIFVVDLMLGWIFFSQIILFLGRKCKIECNTSPIGLLLVGNGNM
jgi:hypothetical protein